MEGISAHRAKYLPIRFLLSLSNGPIVIVPLPSFRWEMKKAACVPNSLDAGNQVQGDNTWKVGKDG
jgi:hypothetical protein